MDIEEVVVSGERHSESLFPGKMNLPLAQVKELTSLAIEPDILKIMQLMPGIQSGKEGSSGLHVRGGSPDQNLYLLDDVPLYYVNHLGGLISTFDPDALKHMEVYKGGFPARYGGRISSVFDLRMKDGNMNERKIQFTIGTISSKFLMEGPVKGNESSYLLSLRRCNFDMFLVPLTLIDSKGKSLAGYNFSDGYFKYNKMVNEKNRIFFSAYAGRDVIYIRSWEKTGGVDGSQNSDKSRTLSRVQWGNVMLSARWNHVFGPAMFANSTLSISNFHYRNLRRTKYQETSEGESSSQTFLFYSGNRDIILKSDFDHSAGNDLKIKWGVGNIFHLVNPGVNEFENIPNIEGLLAYRKMNNSEQFCYAEGIYQWGKFNINGGIRVSRFLMDDAFVSLQPRFFIGYDLENIGIFSLTAARMVQEMHLLSGPGEGIPTDIWIPSTGEIKPMVSDQYSLGYKKNFFRNTKSEIVFTIEGYYKNIENITETKAGYSIYHIGDDIVEKIETGGQGFSRGIEVLLHKKAGYTNGWVGYTFSRNTRQFEAINNGSPYPYRYDRTHDLSLVVNQRINKRSFISATWVYGSGFPVTIPMAKYPVSHVLIAENEMLIAHVYPEKNSHRLPAYHKLDLGYRVSREMKNGTRSVTINIYNVYNRQNPFFLFYRKAADGQIKACQVSLFPFLPSVSYSRSF